LGNHLKTFDSTFNGYAKRIVDATTSVFNGIALSAQFMPTAKKFHYQFNMRDFSRIIQKVMQAESAVYKGNTLGLTRMWAHECHRVYLDRLIMPEDIAKYMEFMTNGCKEFGDFKPEAIFAEPLIYTNFVSVAKGHEAAYLNVKDMDDLK
jgi:dynein heavy chain